MSEHCIADHCPRDATHGPRCWHHAAEADPLPGQMLPDAPGNFGLRRPDIPDAPQPQAWTWAPPPKEGAVVEAVRKRVAG